MAHEMRRPLYIFFAYKFEYYTRCRLRRRLHLGRPRRRRGNLPRRHHNDRRINPLCSQHRRLLLGNRNPNGKNQRQLGAKLEKEQTLTRDTYPHSGRITGWVRAPTSSLPTVPATRLQRSSAEREAEDICEPSKSTPGFISESCNCRSAKGSTLRNGWRQQPPQW
jgi:hypothetical protein